MQSLEPLNFPRLEEAAALQNGIGPYNAKPAGRGLLAGE